MAQTYYQILGIPKNASTDDIKKAHRRLMQHHHPDKGGEAGDVTLINLAYETLKDPIKRADYDRGLLSNYEYLGQQVGKQVRHNFRAFTEAVKQTFFEKTPAKHTHNASDDVYITLDVDVWQIALKEVVKISTEYTTINIALPALVGEPFKVNGAGKPLANGQWSDLYITLLPKDLPLTQLNDEQKQAYQALKKAFGRSAQP